MYNINVQLIDFHNGKIREAVVKNEDDSYTVFIDASLSRIEQEQEYKHALYHIENDHFGKDVDIVEMEAHYG